jgi:hypothetical protein
MVQKKIHTFRSEYTKGRAGLGDLSVEDGIMLMDLKETDLGYVDCIYVVVVTTNGYTYTPHISFGLMFH